MGTNIVCVPNLFIFVCFWCKSPDIRPLLPLKEVTWSGRNSTTGADLVLLEYLKLFMLFIWESEHASIMETYTFVSPFLRVVNRCRYCLNSILFSEVLCRSLKNRLHLPGPVANGVVACCGPPMWRFIWCHAWPAVAFFVPLDSSSIQVPWDHWEHGSHLGASWMILKNVPSLKQTVRTWKYTPGKGDSYWKPSFLRCHVSFREGIHLKNSRSSTICIFRSPSCNKNLVPENSRRIDRRIIPRIVGPRWRWWSQLFLPIHWIVIFLYQ